MVRVGDKVRHMSEILSQQDEEKRSVVGKVTYVHPKRRFHVVEFELPRGGLVRECFQGVED